MYVSKDPPRTHTHLYCACVCVCIAESSLSLPPSLCVGRSGTGFYECMRPYATGVWGLKLLGYEALSY